MITIGDRTFNDWEALDYYSENNELVNGVWLPKKLEKWQEKVNGLCASDYGAIPDGGIPITGEVDWIDPAGYIKTEGEANYENTCGPTPEELVYCPMEGDDPKLLENIRVCSEEESAEIDDLIFNSDYARDAVDRLTTEMGHTAEKLGQINSDSVWNETDYVESTEIAITAERLKRKATPIYSGVLAYFPDAWSEIAMLSQIGNDQHNPGKPLHWDRSKSGDELDALLRHLTDHANGTPTDTDGVLHLTKVAWRALAALQKELEHEQTIPEGY